MLECLEDLHCRRGLAGLDALSSRFLSGEATRGLNQIVVQTGLATLLPLLTTLVAALLTSLVAALLTSLIAALITTLVATLLASLLTSLLSGDYGIAGDIQGGSLDETC